MNVTRLHPAIQVRNLRAPVVSYTLWLQYRSPVAVSDWGQLHYSTVL